MKPPFRIEPRTFHPRTDAHGIQRVTSLSDYPAEKLIDQIKASPQPSESLIRLALAHPDERVLVAAIDRWKNRLWSETSTKTALAVLERGVRICETEKIGWHPIFDALAANACWPYDLRTKEFTEDRYRFRYWLASFIPWLEAQTDPQQVEPLLAYRSQITLQTVAEHAGALTEELALRLIQKTPYAFSALARNSRITPALGHWLLERAVEVLTLSSNSPWDITPELCSQAGDAIAHLAEVGCVLPSHSIDRLIEQLRDRLSFAFSIVVRLLKQLGPQITPDQLKTALGYLPENYRSGFVDHPSATSEIWAYALDSTTKQAQFDVKLALSRNLTALRDSNIRRKIFATTSDRIISKALNTAASADDEVFLEILKDCTIRAAANVTRLVVYGTSQTHQAWRMLLLERHLDRFVEWVIQSKNVNALRNLLLFDLTARDERILRAYIRHPRALVDELLALAEKLRGDDFRHIVRQIADRGASVQHCRLLDGIAHGQFPGATDLSRNDLAPFLSSHDRDVRTQAIVALSALRDGMTASHPPIPEPDRNPPPTLSR